MWVYTISFPEAKIVTLGAKKLSTQNLQRERGYGRLYFMSLSIWENMPEWKTELFPNRLSILEIDELIPGITKRVTQIMNSDQIDDFVMNRDGVLRQLQGCWFYPKDLYIEKKWQPFIALELFLTAILMHLLANKLTNDWPKKSNTWWKPYTGKRRNKFHKPPGFNF